MSRQNLNRRRRADICRIFWLILILIALGKAQDTTDVKIIYGEITINTLDGSAFERRSIIDHYADQTVSDNSYKELTNRILNAFIQDGYIYPVLTLNAVDPITVDKSTRLNPQFLIDRGEQVVIDTVIFTGVKRTAPELLNRESRFIFKQVPDQKKITAFTSNINYHPFLSVQSQPELVKTREGQYGLVVQIAERSVNNFSGVIGYIPETATAKGYFTGEVDINLNNIGGRGRRLNVYWSKANRYSQQIDLRYFEPWIRQSNFSAEGQFSQILRDTLVVMREFESGISRRLLRNGSAALKFNYSATMPTSGGRQLLGLTDLRTRGLGGAGRYDARDYPANPQKGFTIGFNAYVSRRIEQKMNRLWQYRVEVDGEVDLKLYSQLVATCGWNYKGKWLSKGVPVYSDYYWFGGARSLRGYANELFGGAEIAWLNNELRWLIGKNGRAHLFFDQGYYRRSLNGVDKRYYPSSYGIGLRLDSRAGVIGLDYGFGRGDTFSTAKIHVFLESTF